MLLAALIGSAGTASAAWPDGSGPAGRAWASVKSDWHYNNAWPYPFILQDRQSIPGTFQVFVDRGWERQCLLGEHHFDENKKLSTTGQLRVRYILTQTPPQHRTVFIERGNTEQITKARVDAAQQAIAGMVIQGSLPEVAVSNLFSEGWSAEYVDAVNRKVYASMPTPRLPAASAESSSSEGQ